MITWWKHLELYRRPLGCTFLYSIIYSTVLNSQATAIFIVLIHIYFSESLLRRNQKIKEMLNVEKMKNFESKMASLGHSDGNLACLEFFGGESL